MDYLLAISPGSEHTGRGNYKRSGTALVPSKIWARLVPRPGRLPGLQACAILYYKSPEVSGPFLASQSGHL